MKSVEIGLAAHCECECGHSYRCPVVIRTGEDARDSFLAVMKALDPDDLRSALGTLDKAIDTLDKAIENMPESVEREKETSWENVRAFQWQVRSCPKCDKPNFGFDRFFAFTCDECGEETHLEMEQNLTTVCCPKCQIEYKADMSLIGSMGLVAGDADDESESPQ